MNAHRIQPFLVLRRAVASTVDRESVDATGGKQPVVSRPEEMPLQSYALGPAPDIKRRNLDLPLCGERLLCKIAHCPVGAAHCPVGVMDDPLTRSLGRQRGLFANCLEGRS